MTDIQTTLLTATNRLSSTSDSALLDAEVLLCYVLKKPRSHLRAWPEKELGSVQYKHFQALLKQRQQGKPIAYIVGSREFWSRDFVVNQDVLIPRPETELLIELSLNLLANKSQAQIIDLGTGSGIIAITLAAERPDLEITATDLSHKALEIAQQNAASHQIKNIRFIQSCWFDSVPESKFDLVISNPPYIEKNDPHLSTGDLRFEPDSALIAKERGLKDINIISHDARNYLKAKGTLLLEHGYNQQQAMQTLFKSLAYCNIKTHVDLSKNPRVTTGQWNPS
jgi:release factor glutamine methyltransferase